MPTSAAQAALAFPRHCHRFLRKLAANNDREWFDEHRDEYHKDLLEPARAFVRAIGPRLQAFAPEVTADPRANGQGSISRIQRDTRFFRDRPPYRSFLGLLFWYGDAERKWERPGFHLVLQPGIVKLAAGIRRFAPDQLHEWRQQCADPRLARILARLETGRLEIGGSHYKRVPKGCEAIDERHADLLCHRGLFVVHEAKIRVGFCGEEFLALCLETWRIMAPLNHWLQEVG